MSFEELPYAFCRHATSKIDRFEDIYSLDSFGFRGEALASICSISRLTCISSPKEEGEKAGKLIIHGGEQIAHAEIPRTPESGTSIYIKDLFFNTPVRLKFIKSKVSEKNSLKKIINAFLISNPEVSFSVKWDDKEKVFFPSMGEETIKDRISKIFFKKNFPDKTLIEFSGEYDGYRVRGFYSTHKSRGNVGKHQYLFSNKRNFSDVPLHRTVIRTLDSFWQYGETGHYLVMIDVPPNEIDVNVHPNKTQIKFFKSSVVFSLISSSIKQSIQREKVRVRPESAKPFSQEGLFNSTDDKLTLIQDKNLAEGEGSTAFLEQFSFVDSEANNGVLGKAEDLLKVFIDLTDNYSLIRIAREPDAFQLLCKAKLFGIYLAKCFKENYPIDEHKIIPLLISEPFSLKDNKVESCFEYLKRMGLEIDPLDESTLVLRSIPEYLNEFSIVPPVNHILKIVQRFPEGISENEFLLFLEKTLQASTSLESNMITKRVAETILKIFGIEKLKSLGIITPLNDDQLKRLAK